MAQPAQTMEEKQSAVWPKAVFLNKVYAAAFQCVVCGGVPKECMHNEDGDVLCSQCGKDIDNAWPVKGVQAMINKLKIRCLTNNHQDQQNDDNVEGTDLVITPIKEDECEWMGMIKQWVQHSEQCPFLVIKCKECKIFQSQRKLMDNHIDDECPETTIECPLLCGVSILRKDKDIHLTKECMEYMMVCSNNDCKEEIKRKNFNQHIAKQCEMRMVQCQYAKFGCSTKAISAKELKKHLEGYKFEHLSIKFDFITSKQNDIIQGLEQQNERLQTKSNQQNDMILNLMEKLNEAKSIQSNKLNQISNKQNEKIRGLQQQNERLQTKSNQLSNAMIEQNNTISQQNNTISRLTIKIKSNQKNDIIRALQIKSCQEKQNDTLWQNAIYSKTNTGTVNENKGWYCLIDMILPQKRAKFVCKYHFIGHGVEKSEWCIYYQFKLGNKDLMSQHGLNLHKNHSNYYGLPLSGSYIVELNGNENEQQRKLGLYHYGHSDVPSGMKDCFIECYELPSNILQ